MQNVYRYPYTMLSQQTDYLQIDAIEYTPIGSSNISKKFTIPEEKDENGKTIREEKNFTSTSLVGRPQLRKNSNKKSEATILLPIPSNISDTNSVSYESSNLNSIAGAAVGGVMGVMESGKNFGIKNPADAAKNVVEATVAATNAIGAATGGMGEVQNFVTRFLASKAVGLANVNITPDQILARSEGRILNPNMELLFNGPGLRSFRFQFKLTPRGKREAMEVENIIRTFKKRMAPKVDGSGTFLKTPDIFELRYRKGNGEHPFLNKFKQCFLQSINVNYTGEGTYATYNDGTPVSMTMDLSFQEIEPIYDTDYEGINIGVGY